jgi:two-component system, OmpR family, phosphate regulon sensor histidine kinase PhoR
LELGRSLYATGASIAACSSLIETLTQGQVSRGPAGWCLAGTVWGVPVALVGCIAVAMGVIWLGWNWLRLGRAIASIAKPFEDARVPDVEAGRSVWTWLKRSEVQRLCKAVREHLNGCTARVAQYEKQIKDLRLQIQLSQKREKNTEAIIYGIRDAVIVSDEYDKLLMANEAAGRLFGFDFRNAQHQPLSGLIGPDHAEFAELLSHSRKSKNQATRRELGFSEEGGQGTFDCIVSCVYDQDRQVCGVVAVLHDITREKQIQQMKNDFVSHVSHELKTPLASITAYSEMLADGEAADEGTRKEFYSVIQNQAQRLNRLIEDILNTSRIESGLVKVNKELVSLTMLIEEQLQMIKSYAEEKSIEVVGQTPIVFDRVYVDRDMMSQVIVNLLSNAVKYTPSGGSVKIETTVDEAASVVRVTVTDTGVGIPEDEIARVFDKFYRVGANKKQATGTGLGLTLVKQIIEQVHEGRVFVTSRVGVGSTFGFELPLATRESAGIV